jgi:hypothetical protein
LGQFVWFHEFLKEDFTNLVKFDIFLHKTFLLFCILYYGIRIVKSSRCLIKNVTEMKPCLK